MSISSDEINYLIYRYLLENGYSHSAFTFAHESLVTKSSVAQVDVPPGALIVFMQKGLEYVGIEEHINEDGTVREFDGNFALLSPFICDAVAIKEERRQRKATAKSATSGEPVTAKDESSSSGATDRVSLPESGKIGIPANDVRIQKGHDGIKYLQLAGHQGEVFMCSWNPAALLCKDEDESSKFRQLATGSADGICRIWNLESVSEDLWRDASAAADSNSINAISLRTGILPHASCIGEKMKDVTSVSWSPDGKYVATGCYDGLARVWCTATCELKFLLNEHKESIFSVKWNRKSSNILTVSHDKRAIVWNSETGKIVRIFENIHKAAILDADWRDGDVFATCSTDTTISICRLSKTETDVVHTFTGHVDEINALCWSPGGHYLASCSDDTTAKVWIFDDVNAANSKLFLNLLGHTKEIYTTRWTPTGEGSANPTKELLLCTASFDGFVKVWSLSNGGSVLYSLSNTSSLQPVYSVSASPNGEYLAIGSQGGYVSLWSLQDGKLLREEKGVGDTFDVSWSYDGVFLSACFASGFVSIMHIESILSAGVHEVKDVEMSSTEVNSENVTVKEEGMEVQEPNVLSSE